MCQLGIPGWFLFLLRRQLLFLQRGCILDNTLFLFGISFCDINSKISMELSRDCKRLSMTTVWRFPSGPQTTCHYTKFLSDHSLTNFGLIDSLAFFDMRLICWTICCAFTFSTNFSSSVSGSTFA